MELRIRGIDLETLEKIDRIAQNKNMSRTQYIRTLLADYTEQVELLEAQQKHDEEITMLRDAVEKNIDILTKLYELIDNE